MLVLRVHSTSPNMHFNSDFWKSSWFPPTTGRSYNFMHSLRWKKNQEACWLLAGLKSSFVLYRIPTLLDSWKLRHDAPSTWTPRLTWSKRPFWGSSHRCWNSWCWLLLKKNEGLIIFCHVLKMIRVWVQHWLPENWMLYFLLLVNNVSNLCRLEVLNFEPYPHWNNQGGWRQSQLKWYGDDHGQAGC